MWILDIIDMPGVNNGVATGMGKIGWASGDEGALEAPPILNSL
jgi:hypothetical protein